MTNEIYIFWPEDIYLPARRCISSGQKIYIFLPESENAAV